MIAQSTRGSLNQVQADVLAVGVFDGDEPVPSDLIAGTLDAVLGRLAEAKELPKAVGEVMPMLGFDPTLVGLAARAVVLFGLGKPEKFDAGAAFGAGVAVGKRLASKKRATVAVLLPLRDRGADVASVVSSLVEGMIVGTESAELYKAERSRHAWETLIVIGPEQASELFEPAVERGRIVGEAVNLARRLVNLPSAEKRPRAYAAMVVAEARQVGLSTASWTEAQIQDARFGGLVGVAAGSDEPPAFVILEHKLGGDAPTLALVGKGVTFDSGGLSLKPSASMEDMKCDMTGSAVVAATLLAVARLGLKVNVVGYLPIVENMVNGQAMRLGDVLTMRNGKTVEILNTDAEGRLILADALAYAAEQGPARIVDLATLTGACLVALGNRTAGLCSNDDAFAAEVAAASKATGERTWRLPLDEDYLDLLKSQVADLKNVGGKYAGAITAAKFLEQFVAETPWVHLDIAGPAWADADSPTRDAGGTGCFVRTLVALAENQKTPRDT